MMRGARGIYIRGDYAFFGVVGGNGGVGERWYQWSKDIASGRRQGW